MSVQATELVLEVLLIDYFNTNLVSVQVGWFGVHLILLPNFNTNLVSVQVDKTAGEWAKIIFQYKSCVGSSNCAKVSAILFSVFQYKSCVGSRSAILTPY